MVTDARTTNRNYPKPNSANLVSEDFPRLIQALDAIDVDVAGLLTSVAGRALLLHSHTIDQVTGLQAALYGKSASGHNHAFDDLSDVNLAGATNGQTIKRVGGVWQPADIGGLDASAITSGVFDPARIPVIGGQVPVVSSGGLGALTSPQQASIDVGTIVMTTDGLRWVYSVDGGSKTDSASYIQLADITPEWATVANKPSTFPPSAHTHTIGDTPGLQSALDGKVAKSGDTMTGQLGVSLNGSDIAALTTSGASSILKFGVADGASGGASRMTYDRSTGSLRVEIGAMGALIEAMRVTESGKVGIGTGAPLTTLDVAGPFTVRSDICGPSSAHAYTIGANPYPDAALGGYVQLWGSTSPNPGLVILGQGAAERLLIPPDGAMTVKPATSKPFQVGVNDQLNTLVVARNGGAGGALGGIVRLVKPSSSTSLTDDVNIDLYGSSFRVYENGGSARGFSIDLSACASGAASVLMTAGNLGSQIAGLAYNAVGQYGFMTSGVSSHNAGDSAPGSYLGYSNSSANSSSTPSGTWRVHGYLNVGTATLCQRVA
jgi:hypothetical protein